MLFFSANARRHVGARQGYYGNCVTAQLVTEKSGAVAGGWRGRRRAGEEDQGRQGETIPDQFKDDVGGGRPRRATHPHVRCSRIGTTWSFDEVKPREREAGEGDIADSLPGVRGAAAVVVKEKHADAILGEVGSCDMLVELKLNLCLSRVTGLSFAQFVVAFLFMFRVYCFQVYIHV